MSRSTLRAAVRATIVLALLCPAATAEHDVVLIAGDPNPDDPETEFFDPACLFRYALTDTLNWLPENITMLSYDGSHTWDGSPVPAATKANIESTLAGFSSLGPDDTFLLWASSHGSGTENAPATYWEEDFSLHGDDLVSDELPPMVAGIGAGRQAYVIESCFGGGLLEALKADHGVGSEPGRFGCTACNHYEVSWYNHLLSPFNFIDGFRQGIAAGLTSTHDLYDYAYTNDQWATDGEGPGGTWFDPDHHSVEHPWKVGDDYDIAVAAWSGNQNGSWTDPDNWWNAVEPDTDRFVRIQDNTHDAVISAMSDTVRQLRVCPGTVLKLASGGILNVTANAENAGGAVQIPYGVLDVTGDLVNSDPLSHIGIGTSGVAYAQNLTNAGDVGVASLLHVYNDATSSGTFRVHSGGVAIIDHNLRTETTASLTLDDAGSIMHVKHDFEANGTVEAGPGTRLWVDNMVYAGYGGSGGTAQMDFDQADVQVGNQMLIGVGYPATVTSTRSTLDVASLLSVGERDEGTLNVYAGEVKAIYLYVGHHATADGHLLLDASHATGPEVRMKGLNPTIVVGNKGDGLVTHNAGKITRDDPDLDYPTIILGHEATGKGDYKLNHGEVRAYDLEVGRNGLGTLTQQGGLVSVTHSLSLALLASSDGSYEISEGAVITPELQLGVASKGTVTQNGGLVQVDNTLTFGVWTSGDGTYDLNGGTLKVAQIDNGAGHGALNVDGGILDLTGSSLEVESLSVGNASGTVGVLTLGNKHVATKSITVGGDGEGTFTKGGGLTTASSRVVVGFYDAGTLNHTGGHLETPYVYLGYASSGTGDYTLEGGSLTVTGLSVGYNGEGHVTQRNATSVAAGTVIVGASGEANTYRLEDGQLTATAALRLGTGSGDTGEFELLGGKLKTGETIVGDGGTGTFIHSGGTHGVTGALTVGKSGTSSTYTLSGAASLLLADSSTVGHQATALFTHNDGTHRVGTDLTLGTGASGLGTYDLNGGTLWVGGHVYAGHDGGTGCLNMNGGTLTGPANTLFIGGPGDAVSGFGILDMTVENSGSLGAAGGLLAVQRSYKGSGSVSVAVGAVLEFQADAELTGPVACEGSLHIAGGTTHLLGGLVGGRAATANILPGAELRTHSDLGSTRTVVQGTLDHEAGAHETLELYVGATKGTATYDLTGGSLAVGDLHIGASPFGRGPMRGQFRLLDPNAHVTVHGSLTLYEGGSLHTVEGSAIHMTGSPFANYSTDPAALAGLNQLELIFEGGGGDVDPFEVAGRFTGLGEHAFKSNFALAALTLGASAGIGQVQLVDLADNQPGWDGSEVLYVRNLVVGPGSTLDINGLSLVYLDATIDPEAVILLNGGTLVQAPEPATLVLLGAGLAALLRRRRRR